MNRKALIIGINDYPKSPLFSCIKDARKFAETIKYNSDKSGKKVKNFDITLKTKIEDQSTLKRDIVRLFKSTCETALFYFAGHGYVDQFGSGYIVTPDYKAYDEGISMDEILLIANRSEIKNKIIILDCCHSGAMGSPALIGGSLIKEGIVILAASRKSEKAKENSNHGAFTSLLLEGLEGSAADLEGKISPGGLYAFIDKAMGPDEQRPVFKANVSRFVLLRAVERKIPKEILTNIATYFKSADSECLLDPSFEYTNTLSNDNKPVQPYAKEKNTQIFKELQQMTRAGLVVPVNEEHMYFAAMHSGSCQLTALGRYYWKLIKEDKIIK